MIDIHCHILPGLDDGALDLTESLAMARLAVEEGIHTIIATPHHANGAFDNEANSVIDSVASLNKALQEAEIPLTVKAGQEIRVYRDLLDDLNSGRLLNLGDSRYMLIEFPTRSVPDGIEDLIHELKLLGIIPIIAHPERNIELAGNPSRLRDLIQIGVLTQVTSHSIVGLFGKKIQEASLSFCRHNLVHFIASDAHNTAKRPFNLNRAYQIIGREVNDEQSEYFKHNARAIITNNTIDLRELHIKKRKWFQFW